MAIKYIVASSAGYSEGGAFAERVMLSYHLDTALTTTTGITSVLGRTPLLGTIVTVLECVYIPEATLTSNDTNYATLTVNYYDSNGANAVALAIQTTKTTVGGGSGDFVALAPVAMTLQAGIATLGRNNPIALVVTKASSGVTLPTGTLQLTYTMIPGSGL